MIINLAEYRAARGGACASHEALVVPVDDAIEMCLEHPDILSAWEAHFLVSIRRSCTELSPKQRAILQRIFDKTWSIFEPDNAS